MKHLYAGWMRRESKQRWYQVCEHHDYEECHLLLKQWAIDNRLKITGSLVILPFGVVPCEAMKRRKK